MQIIVNRPYRSLSFIKAAAGATVIVSPGEYTNIEYLFYRTPPYYGHCNKKKNKVFSLFLS